jgi:hypothetical protein
MNAKKEAPSNQSAPACAIAPIAWNLNNKIKGDQDIGPWSNTDYLALRWYP